MTEPSRSLAPVYACAAKFIILGSLVCFFTSCTRGPQWCESAPQKIRDYEARGERDAASRMSRKYEQRCAAQSANDSERALVEALERIRTDARAHGYSTGFPVVAGIGLAVEKGFPEAELRRIAFVVTPYDNCTAMGVIEGSVYFRCSADPWVLTLKRAGIPADFYVGTPLRAIEGHALRITRVAHVHTDTLAAEIFEAEVAW